MTVKEKLRRGGKKFDRRDIQGLRSRSLVQQSKVIKAGPGATSAMVVTPQYVDISAAATHSGEPVGITAVSETGVAIRGPVGFTTTPGNIRIASMWTMNPLLLAAAPSTILTPIPVLQFNPPFKNLTRVATSAFFATAFLGFGNG